METSNLLFFVENATKRMFMSLVLAVAVMFPYPNAMAQGPEILTGTNAVTVPEGGTATFDVQLNTAPMSPMTVTVSWVSGDADLSVQSGQSLVFDASNWNTNQTVTLAAADDADQVNGSAIIRCSAPETADKDVTATEEDNDVINLALASRGSTITGNNGTNWSALIDGVTTGYNDYDGYGMTWWANDPDAPGTMTLDLKDLCVISSTKLLLWDLDNRYYQYNIEASLDNMTWTTIVDRTTSTWQSWQAINFNPAIQARYLRLTGTFNSANYGFIVVEWEVYGTPPLEILTSTNAVTVAEGGTATFDVRLNTAPISPTTVTVSWVSGDVDISVQSGQLLVFDASNWNTNQPVTLAAANDADGANGSATIRCSAPETADQDVTATEEDNTPALAILTSTNAVTVPEGGTATFDVRLNTAPISPTTVTVSWVSGDVDISVQSGQLLVFDASNWNTNQPVTLAAANDADQSNGSATIRCSAAESPTRM